MEAFTAFGAEVCRRGGLRRGGLRRGGERLPRNASPSLADLLVGDLRAERSEGRPCLSTAGHILSLRANNAHTRRRRERRRPLILKRRLHVGRGVLRMVARRCTRRLILLRALV